jgi:hypothetical protein
MRHYTPTLQKPEHNHQHGNETPINKALTPDTIIQLARQFDKMIGFLFH